MDCHATCLRGSGIGPPSGLVACPHSACPAHYRILSKFLGFRGDADTWTGELERWQVGIPSPWADARGIASVFDSFMEATILSIRIHSHREWAA